MIQSYITHFRITGHGFLRKILLRDIKSVGVNKTSVPKITSQPRNFATNSIQSPDRFSGQNCPTISACKIDNFCPSHLKFWNRAFQTVYFTTVQKQIWFHMPFKLLSYSCETLSCHNGLAVLTCFEVTLNRSYKTSQSCWLVPLAVFFPHS